MDASAHQPVPSSPLRFCGVGDSDEFFDLVLLHGGELVVMTTQDEAARDALRQRVERGESLDRVRAEAADQIFSYEAAPAARVRQVEWCEQSDVLRVEYETSLGGRRTDVGGWLDAAAVPKLLEALQASAGPIREIRDEVVTARGLIVRIVPAASAFVALLTWGTTDAGWLGALAAGIVSMVVLSGILWYANRKPSICHVATFG